MTAALITITLEKMTDAQYFLDYAHSQFNKIAADVERQFDTIASSLRDQFLKTGVVHATRRRIPIKPPTTWQLAQEWMVHHKRLTAALVAFVVTGSVATLVYANTSGLKRKRRGRKAPSGARIDVVVVVGAVANPLMNALYLDLERRGFVVYVVTPTVEDEHYIKSLSRADLYPLRLDLVDPFIAQNQVARFETLFGSSRTHYAFEGAEPHHMHFRGLILVPDTQSPPANVEDITAEDWSDALNAKVLNTIATAHIFLPSVIESKAKVMVLAPSITPTLRPPMHALESTVYGALQGFTGSLASELARENVSLTEFKLGHIDIPAVTLRQRKAGVPEPWLKPTPIRTLHNAVFDTLVARSPPRTRYIGRGASTYDLIVSLTPESVLFWLMGAPSRYFQRRAKFESQYGQGRSLGGLGGSMSDEEMRGSSGSLTWEKIDEEA